MGSTNIFSGTADINVPGATLLGPSNFGYIVHYLSNTEQEKTMAFSESKSLGIGGFQSFGHPQICSNKHFSSLGGEDKTLEIFGNYNWNSLVHIPLCSGVYPCG